MNIPTKMTAPLTSAVINGRRYKLFPTDAGLLTGRQIEELTGVKAWKVLQRYNKLGRVPGIFCKDKMTFERGLREKMPNDFPSGEEDRVAKLSGMPRNHNLAKIKVGTWEAENCRLR